MQRDRQTDRRTCGVAALTARAKRAGGARSNLWAAKRQNNWQPRINTQVVAANAGAANIPRLLPPSPPPPHHHHYYRHRRHEIDNVPYLISTDIPYPIGTAILYIFICLTEYSLEFEGPNVLGSICTGLRKGKDDSSKLLVRSRK